MKVLIIGFGQLYIMPYMHFYLKFLLERKCAVHLLYWDRDGGADQPVPEGITATRFEFPITEHLPRWKKIRAFWNYRKVCGQLLDSGEFEFVLVLTTPPGILMLGKLRRHFRKNYIFDFRDVTLEKYWIFRKWVRLLMRNAAVTFVSSNGFRKYYPGENIHTIHNILLDTLDHRDIRRSLPREISPIRVRFWGLIRHEEINKKIINKLANDPRFELHYHGRESLTSIRLIEYCNQLQTKNIFFHGFYKPEERYGFASETDILHNIYENDEVTTQAMGNKFYDGIALYLPQICSNNSHMGEELSRSGVGLACDPSREDFADSLFAYYRAIDWSEFESRCDQKLEETIREYHAGLDVMDATLTKAAHREGLAGR